MGKKELIGCRDIISKDKNGFQDFSFQSFCSFFLFFLIFDTVCVIGWHCLI